MYDLLQLTQTLRKRAANLPLHYVTGKQ